MLSFLGHSPTFAARDVRGELWGEPGTLAGAGGELTIRSDSLELLDQVSARDRHEIEERMRREVLETAAFPEIRFVAEAGPAGPADGPRRRVRVTGRLTLHGVTRPEAVDGDLLVYGDGVRLVGGGSLRMSDYRIRPVTALGGSIRLKDQLRVEF